MKTTTPLRHRTDSLCNGNHQWVRGKRNACITEPTAYAMKTTNGYAANVMPASQNRQLTQWKPPHRVITEPAAYAMKTTPPLRHRTDSLCNENHQWVRGKRNACITEPTAYTMETTTPCHHKTGAPCNENHTTASSQNRQLMQWKPPHRAIAKPAPAQ